MMKFPTEWKVIKAMFQNHQSAYNTLHEIRIDPGIDP
jgi:hypothetical protein